MAEDKKPEGERRERREREPREEKPVELKKGEDGKYIKPEAPSQPNENEYTAAKEVLDKKLETLREKVKKLSDTINKAQDGKEDYESQKKVLQDDFETAKGKFDELRTKQFELINQIKQQNEQAKENKRELRDLNKSLGMGGEESIDGKIRELEYKMQTGTISLKQEKDMMAQIKELKKKKPLMAQMAKKADKLNEDLAIAGDSSKPLDEQIKECREKIEVAKKDKEEKKQALDALRATRSKQREAVSGEIKQKDGVKEEMTSVREEMRKIGDVFYKARKAYRDWQWECRKIDDAIRNERWEEDNKKWKAEEKKRQLEKQSEKPFFDEMVLIEQTTTYCNNLLNPTQGEKEEAKKTAADFEAIEGRTVLLSKKDREEEFFLAPKKGRKNKKFLYSQDGGEKKEKTTDMSKRIQHNMGTFQLFEELSKLGDKKDKVVISAPLTLGDVQGVLDALKVKEAYYNKKISEWEVEREKLAKEIAEGSEGEKAEEETEATTAE